jgi:hypothetical protein
MNALEIARGPLEADDRRQRRYVTRTVGKTTPRDASITDRPKHARRRESPSDLVRCRKAKGFRNRTTRRLPVHHRDGHTLVVRISSPALLDETLEVATPRVAGRTTMAPHANALHALHGPGGDVTFDREIVRHRREASFEVRSQGVLRSHAEALIRGRESAPERHDGDVPFMRANGLNRHRTWGLGSRGSPPCVPSRVGCTWRSKLPAASDPMLVVPRERRRTSEIGLDRARLLEPNLHHADGRGGSAPRRERRRGSRDREVPLTRVHRKRSIEAGALYRASPPGSPPRERWGSRGAVS